MYQLSSDSEFSFQLEILLSKASGGALATGELLRAAAVIKPGDFESWYNEFKLLGDKLHALAVSVDSKRFPVSAREQYFHASTHYRTATFFLHGNASDPRLGQFLDLQLADFDNAVKLLPQPGQPIELKTSYNFTVPAYFYPAPQHGNGHPERLPTVILGTGYDGTQQDLYHELGHDVHARGWNFITYEGPGQYTVRQKQGVGFIPEWWEVITPVVDYLATRNDVDMDKVALGGISYGGVLAPIAATREHRLAAVLAIDGLVDPQKLIVEAYNASIPEAIQLFEEGNRTGFNAYLKEVYNQPGASNSFRWLLDEGIWAFNTPDAYGWLQKMGTIYLNETMAQQISCPVFVGSGQDDAIGGGGQPEMLANMLGKKAFYYLFDTDIGAGEHTQAGAESVLAMVALDWLADVFEGKTGNNTARH
ncbi:alpha/beta-hydrolase [Microthyrium microscopicum]|uniref:Alpha/beta-hydrolase n=1 Tax=Microthyrium microscopicum TaxID=703497 RepID=A0A6A6TWZ4_9PEZI|nr:alpha/beta-hydrolase [Microthyrium microscopicum]